MGKMSICRKKITIQEESCQGLAATMANIGTVLGTTVVLMTPLSTRHPKKNDSHTVPASFDHSI